MGAITEGLTASFNAIIVIVKHIMYTDLHRRRVRRKKRKKKKRDDLGMSKSAVTAVHLHPVLE